MYLNAKPQFKPKAPVTNLVTAKPIEPPDQVSNLTTTGSAGRMPSNQMRTRPVLAALLLLFTVACAVAPPVERGTLTFEKGIMALAGDLCDQLERSSIGNLVNRVVKKQFKNIVIDPFVDVESGYPVKVSLKITELIAGEFEARFTIAGQLEPEILEVSEYVLNGMVTLVETGNAKGAVRRKGNKNEYKVRATVFEKSTGKVLATASVVVSEFDTTPMDIYRDSPVFLKSKNYEQLTSSIKKTRGESVEDGYYDRLMVKAIIAKADALYEKREYAKSLAYYNQAADSLSAPNLEVLNGQFTNYMKQGLWNEATAAYGKLIRASISETKQVASKITFAPNSVTPLNAKAVQYNVYITEIAALVTEIPGCRIKIVGHSSRTGSEGYNDTLSLRRSEEIQKLMAVVAPGIPNKSETAGRGYRENIVGTGTDSVTDEIDRRVEFIFTGCEK